MRLQAGRYVQVDSRTSQHGDFVGMLLNWRDVPMIQYGTNKVRPDISGFSGSFEPLKQVAIKGITNKVIVTDKKRVSEFDSSKQHWRIWRDDNSNNHHMFVIPYGINEFPEPGYAMVVTGLVLGPNESSKDAWEALKHRLHVNAGSGSIAVEDVRMTDIAERWVPVSWKDVPEHIRTDFSSVAAKALSESVHVDSELCPDCKGLGYLLFHTLNCTRCDGAGTIPLRK